MTNEQLWNEIQAVKGRYLWQPWTRPDSTRFPFEPNSLVCANFFRGDNESPPKSFQRDHDYTYEGFCGIIPEGMALRSTDAWGAENLTPWGKPEGDYPSDPDKPTADEWEAAEGEEIDPNADDWHYEEWYNTKKVNRKKKKTKKDYRREEREEEDAAWKLLQKVGLKPENLWDESAELKSMLYVSKIYRKEGNDGLIKLFSANIDKIKTGKKIWNPERQNKIIVDFCKGLGKRKVFYPNMGYVTWAQVCSNGAKRSLILMYQLRNAEMSDLGVAIWGEDYRLIFAEWNFARKTGLAANKKEAADAGVVTPDEEALNPEPKMETEETQVMDAFAELNELAEDLDSIDTSPAGKETAEINLIKVETEKEADQITKEELVEPEPAVFTVSTYLARIAEDADYIEPCVYVPLFNGSNPYEVFDKLVLEDDTKLAVKLNEEIKIYKVIGNTLGFLGLGRTLTSSELRKHIRTLVRN